MVADDNVTATEHMIDDGNESKITMDEILEALKCMKIGIAVGYDRTSSEVLRSGEAHRLVLAATSPYIEALFSSGLKETNEELVHLTSIPPEVLPTLVDFLYTGTPVHDV
ncbi:Kelch-like protein 21 [Eumeta japonica]|uniref:Kelch-like protein 21 n=1 Tax=Eumeta variegata TaxID=151549 RepID=A0A4C1VGY4_EUMVA|nr:Kelch-like protein 21 [Eumeta japonica]